MSDLPKIQMKSLRGQVFDLLRDRILDGEYKPGDALIESDLADALDISRAPLREALQMLAAEGLVENVPYKGSKVRLLTAKDIEELYSLRGVLEAFAIQRIIERDDPTDHAELLNRHAAIYNAALAGDLRRVNTEDQNFHTSLIILSNHAMLLSTWNVVANRVRQVMALRNKQNGDILQIAANHIPIIKAIIACDTALATELIHQHVASAADLALENWQYAAEEPGP